MSLFKKFPSFIFILDSARNTFIRFPFTLLNALMGVIVAIILIEDKVQDQDILQKLLLIAFLGLPLFTALAFLTEKRKWVGAGKYVPNVIGILLLAGYYFTLRGDLFEIDIVPIRFLLLNIGLHFLVAFLPFLGKDQINGFWQYNKSLFLRFLLSALYSGVLYVGLSLALVALDYLFGVDVDENYYVELWVIMAGLFNTWFFLAGVPEDLEALNTASEYPAGLKVFAQYILLPLVGLYFFILISYELKIIFTMNLPKGWVSQMVLWYAVVGILSMLLLYPLRNKSENRWILIFSKWFFRILIPLVGMLWFAIIVRVSNYGITENRYFVLAMALGLSIVVLYFVFSKIKDIRIIPIVLCVIAFLSAYGPWSAFALSLNSQKSRLVTYLEKNNLLENGYIVKASEPISFEDRKEISSIVSYLNSHYGKEIFQEWLDDSSYASIDTVSRYSMAFKITEKIGFKYINEWEIRQSNQYFNIRISENEIVPIMNYDYMFNFNIYPTNDLESSQLKHEINGRTYEIKIDSLSNIYFSVEKKNPESTRETILVDSLSFSITNQNLELIKSDANGELNVHNMTILIPSDNVNAALIITNLSGTYKDEEPRVQNLSGYFLLGADK